MFALAPSPLPPGHTIIHKYSVQYAPYNETGLLIFAILATLLGARFGGCELFVRIDTDTYDDSATAMETATATAATTRTDISQSPSSPFLHPVPDAPVLPWCVHQQRLLCFCFCFCFASAVALPI